MATVSNSLLRTIGLTQNFLKGSPLTNIQGNPIEPAMSIGDSVRQFILSAPFAWRWNRAVVNFNTVAGTQSYKQSLPSFGWLELATSNDNKGTNNSIVTLQNKLNLEEDGAQDRPRYISARVDDDQGNITFRLIPTPDAVYNIAITYQNASPLFVNLSDTWAPIPDYMSNVYNYLYRAFAYEYFDDPRFSFTFQMGLRQLLAASEGLDQTQKNTYMSEFLTNIREQQGVGLNVQLGHQGRGGY
jgi:hypothetical protein